MTTCLLVRHGATEALGHVLAGRAAGYPLSPVGREQVRRLAERLSRRADIAAIYTGPLDRASSTAHAIADAVSVPVRMVVALDEVDYGSWTGRQFGELSSDRRWRTFNHQRAFAAIPSGEDFLHVQLRAVRLLHELAGTHPDQAVVIVSHADVIRAALAASAGMAPDLVQRFDIAPASITTVRIRAGRAHIGGVNDTAHLSD